MFLLDIHRCLGDETRLRIMHLLARGQLCVCHFQTVLAIPQAAISKHLAYLRRHGLVDAQRHGQWKIYRLPNPCPRELERQVQCLLDDARDIPVFSADLKRLAKMEGECGWIGNVPPAKREIPRRKTQARQSPVH